MPHRQRGQTEYGENLANPLAMHTRAAARLNLDWELRRDGLGAVFGLTLGVLCLAAC
jgi:hypothetical protein